MTPDRVGVETALEAVERLVVEEERRLHAQVGELATVRAAITGLAVEIGAQGKPEPVSYTHLDVYKRQRHTCRCATSSRSSCRSP